MGSQAECNGVVSWLYPSHRAFPVSFRVPCSQAAYRNIFDAQAHHQEVEEPATAEEMVPQFSLQDKAALLVSFNGRLIVFQHRQIDPPVPGLQTRAGSTNGWRPGHTPSNAGLAHLRKCEVWHGGCPLDVTQIDVADVLRAACQADGEVRLVYGTSLFFFAAILHLPHDLRSEKVRLFGTTHVCAIYRFCPGHRAQALANILTPFVPSFRLLPNNARRIIFVQFQALYPRRKLFVLRKVIEQNSVSLKPASSSQTYCYPPRMVPSVWCGAKHHEI